MGKEGGYWGGRSSKRAEAETPSGCISAFFQLFDFHPFHFSLQHQPQASSNCHHDTVTIPKGTEAPRNSLESEEGLMVSSISSKEENLKIPKNSKLFIKTSAGISSNGNKLANVNDLSPGTKTPTLVARLMGLDLLPDAQSPSSSSPSSSSTTTTSSSCLSATKSQVNSHLHHHQHQHRHLRPRQHNVIITKPRHSMDDSIAASRFLPDTPRISSARRSDVEHRLSLQINKENMGVGENLELPRFSFSKVKKFEEQHSSNNKSPRHYAKQIVKQMKESMMSRKVGIDVTNTVKNNKRSGEQERGGEFVGQFMRSKKSPRTPTTSSVSKVAGNELSSPGKVSNNPSCSPRLRFMDPKNKLSTVSTTGNEDQISPQPVVKLDNQPQAVSSVLAQAKPQPILFEEQEAQFQTQKSSVPKCKKAANEKFSPRLKKPIIRNKQDESFVRPLSSPNRASDIKSTSKSKKNHPLLIKLLNLNTVQNINSNTLPAAVNTKIPQKQTQVCDAREAKYCSSQLFSGSSQTYTKEATSSSCILSTTTTGESNVDELDKRKISGSMLNYNGPEFEYVSSILSRTGLAVKKEGRSTRTTVVSVSLFRQWLSPTQPLDPSIFHHLEQQFQNQNQNENPTSNIFSASSQDGNLRPKYDLGVRSNRRLLFDLVNETLLEGLGPYYDEEMVWERITGRFLNKKCEVLEDIDALVEMEDMGKTMMKMKSAEALMAEIEGNIMDTLLHETVRMVTECGCWWWWYGRKDEDDAV
ncbi:uncharacterized protein LOC114726162 [Neltuma alba]|uniref:uncharacterized protein LOC114726162 n=1 Tax=Neltuma alba TaxID=207710 RepID=UPI0010A2F995|nr:uncharacterized protein LOC114726162 [Prosopis alba]